jgi:hypothetical protein
MLPVSMTVSSYRTASNADRAGFGDVWYSTGPQTRDDLDLVDDYTGDAIIPAAADKDQVLAAVMSSWSDSAGYEMRIMDLLAPDRGPAGDGSDVVWMLADQDDKVR